MIRNAMLEVISHEKSNEDYRTNEMKGVLGHDSPL